MKDLLKRVPIWAWLAIFVSALFVLSWACQPDWEDAKTSLNTPVKIEVKYRIPNDGFVPLHSDKYFEKDVSLRKAEDIRVAGYDKDNAYFVVCFGKPFGRGCYHYCRFPKSIWENYKMQTDQDQFYERHIRGRFDCRDGGGKFVPTY